MPKAQLIIRNLLNVHTDAETSRRVKNDTMYNPGGVVIIGSHCDQFPLKYCSVWPKWNTSSIKGPGRSLEISNASPQSSTKKQRSKRLNFKKPVFDDMSLYYKGRKFKKVKDAFIRDRTRDLQFTRLTHYHCAMKAIYWKNENKII
jgi:hypothetical protein